MFSKRVAYVMVAVLFLTSVYGCGGSGGKEQVIMDSEETAKYQEHQRRIQEMEQRMVQQMRGPATQQKPPTSVSSEQAPASP